MKWTRENLITVAAIFTVGTLLLSFIQGWIVMQLPWMFTVTVIIIAAFFFLRKTTVKKYQWQRAQEKARPVFEKLAGGPNYSIRRFFRISDGKRFSTSGKVWAFFGGSASKMAALIDHKTGEVVGGDMDITDESSPIHFISKEPPAWHFPRVRGERVEEKYEKKVKPE